MSLLTIGVFVFLTFSSLNYYKQIAYLYSPQAEKYVTKEYLKTYVKQRGFERERTKDLIMSLAEDGYTIEGYNDGNEGSINYDTIKKYKASYFKSFDFILSIIILLVEIAIFTLLRKFFLNYSWKKNNEKLILKSSILDRILKVLFVVMGFCILFSSFVVIQMTEQSIGLFLAIYSILGLAVAFLIMVLIRYLYFYIGFGKHKYFFNEIEKIKK